MFILISDKEDEIWRTSDLPKDPFANSSFFSGPSFFQQLALLASLSTSCKNALLSRNKLLLKGAIYFH